MESDATSWSLVNTRVGRKGLPHDPGFLVALHVEHLAEWCPSIVPYLALPPGSAPSLVDSLLYSVPEAVRSAGWRLTVGIRRVGRLAAADDLGE